MKSSAMSQRRLKVMIKEMQKNKQEKDQGHPRICLRKIAIRSPEHRGASPERQRRYFWPSTPPRARQEPTFPGQSYGRPREVRCGQAHCSRPSSSPRPELHPHDLPPFTSAVLCSHYLPAFFPPLPPSPLFTISFLPCCPPPLPPPPPSDVPSPTPSTVLSSHYLPPLFSPPPPSFCSSLAPHLYSCPPPLLLPTLLHYYYTTPSAPPTTTTHPATRVSSNLLPSPLPSSCIHAITAKARTLPPTLPLLHNSLPTCTKQTKSERRARRRLCDEYDQA